jgi:hypothetical protein
MNYSEEELKQIEQLASLYMTVSDIAIILDKNAELLRRDINTKDNPAYDAYRRGKVSSKILLRKQEMQLAKVGSPLALDNVRKALMDMEDDE